MKDYSNDQGQCPVETGKPVPQMALRTNLRASADEGCEAGLSYWRKEYNRLKKLAQDMGCA
jgi:hypothetical protein